MEGREVGSPGAARAARLIARELSRIGLTPAGDSTSAPFLQRVPIARQSITLANGETVAGWGLLQSLEARDHVTAPDRPRPPRPPRPSRPSRPRAEAVNVVGLIPGGDPQLMREAVVVSAHYDHLGIGPPVDGDSIYNGADDNASGVVAAIEIARMLAAARPAPRRTVIFLFTTGEERGLLGSRWYLRHPVTPAARTVANLNLEMLSRPDSLVGGRGKAWLTGFERSTVGRTLHQAGLAVFPDPRPEYEFFRRSDNIAFARRGVPAHSLVSFSLHADYHQPSDEARRADPEHLAAVIATAASAVRILADGPAPRWTPGDPYATPARP
jgi:hypothetical protein